jgi:hypothetical protein
MHRVGFEPPIPVLERAKTAHVLDGRATVIGGDEFYVNEFAYVEGSV